MGLPNIPDINPEITLTFEQAVNLLIASIALEEIGISHVLNAEGEKIQTLADMITAGQASMDDIINVQKSVERILKTTIKKEMLLEFKFEDVLELSKKVPPQFVHENTARVEAMFDNMILTSTDNAFYHTEQPLPSPAPAINTNSSNISVQAIIDSVDMGDLTNYLFYFGNGSVDANWQGATNGFIGDVAVNGLVASERTSGSVPYAGIMYTNDTTFGAWQAILDQNPTQATGVTGQTLLLTNLHQDLVNAFNQINALPPTPGFESFNALSLDGLNTQNGINETFVINITSGFDISQKIYITGDPGDVFILRWDEDLAVPGYQGIVKFSSGGGIVPLGGLTPTNFINVAGDINSSGGGTNPLPPYPQGPRYNDGQGNLIINGSDFSGGGFFTGYWLTTGAPTTYDPDSGQYIGATQPLSNGIFVGGWYTLTIKFSMTSGTSGVYVSPNPVTEGEPFIDIEKLVSPDNGLTWYDADVAPGPSIPQGINPQFRFIVANNGNETLLNVTVTDDVYGAIGTPISLLPGASHTYTITVPWQQGQHTNTATVTGTYNNVTFTDSDPANYFGVTGAIDIEKLVSPDNGVTWFDADTPPGPTIPQGTNPMFQFIVTNTGGVTLNNVVVTDNVYGLIGTLPTLAPGASFTWTITVPWDPGQHTNIATATATFDSQTVTDSDPANYLGVTGAIDIEKLVSPDNGATWLDADNPPGPTIPQGTNPQFQFIVTNTGSVTLNNVLVTDNVYGFIGSLPSLAPGASFTWTLITPWQPGQHTNIATATATFDGQTATDSDPANYLGVTGSIDIEKLVSPDNGATWLDADTPPGPTISQGTNPMFKFIVTNTGVVTLNNVVVTDDVYGLIGTLPILAPGASFTWTITVPWQAGQHTNIATATATFDGQTVTDSDPANYLGVTIAIDIEKLVSPDNGTTWFDADTAPGPIIPQGTNPMFQFIVTNTGTTTLFNVNVTDDVFGFIGSLPSLPPGASFSWTITVPWQLGQHTNIATVTAAFDSLIVTDSDPANYLGVIGAIDIEKLVSPDNGVTWLDADTPPGPTIPEGTNPQFQFIVTNTGGVTLNNVTVTDDVYGLIGTLPTLAPGASFTWTITVPWQPGQHTNIATATATFDGQTVTDSDPANYLGVTGAVDIEKLVSPDNGATWLDADTPPGPTIPLGTNPMFQFIVTNTGAVTLNNVVVTDDVYGLIGTLPSLAPGASFTWTITVPWQIGQHTNIATVTATFDGQTVTDSDPANYLGVIGAIDIEKLVSPDNGTTWLDADIAPGPEIPQGTNPMFQFIVTNTGAVTLNNVVVTDDVYGPIGTLPSLAPGASFTWTITVPWAAGQHTNIATATATFDGQTVTDSDPANYLGVTGEITIQKLVSPDNGATWLDADIAPGPEIPQGTNPMFQFIVTNTGTGTLTNLVVVDNVYGLIGTLPSLAPGASFTWTITVPWQPGQHTNIATVTAQFDNVTLTASNPANYVGVIPAILIKKYVSVDNGLTWLDANTAPGPLLPPGVTPQFRFVVTNIGDVTLNNIIVTDNVYGFIGTLPSLAPGASFEWIIMG